MSVKGWSIVSAAALLAFAGAPALAGGFTSISVSSGGYGGLQIGGSYSTGWGGHGGHGGYGGRSGYGHGSHYGGYGVSFRYGYCGPVYRPYPYYAPVTYYPNVVYSAPVVYTQPVVYTSPQVIQRPVVYQQANYQTQYATEPVTTNRVVTQVSQPVAQPVVQETAVVTRAPEVTKPAPAVEQAPLTAYEAALIAIQDRKPGEAIDQLNEHLRVNPNDTRTLRLSAVMYAEQNNCSEAASRMMAAYKADPSLATQPVDAASLGIGAGRMRDITNNAERYSMKLRTGSAYLVTTVLMQAEGRTADAAAMAEKAATAGLENSVATGLQNAFR